VSHHKETLTAREESPPGRIQVHALPVRVACPETGIGERGFMAGIGSARLIELQDSSAAMVCKFLVQRLAIQPESHGNDQRHEKQNGPKIRPQVDHRVSFEQNSAHQAQKMRQR
jgi:hypothetical protein